jgi:alkanesulfonate monooxygenase SsuD/methylene tetrahydromethanopterin reductase-like flavin-dependent oxidoreductase (luciferase family)
MTADVMIAGVCLSSDVMRSQEDKHMHYGFIIPDMTDATTNEIVGLARDAEAAGWDAIFFWDGDWGYSPWITLAAMAVHTEHIRLGAILHPLAWRQPWLFARETASLDQLSHGRLIVSIGLGAVNDQDFARGRTGFGEPVDRKLRAQLLDEGLDVVNRLWSGQASTFEGQHYRLEDFRMRPTPVQLPRIPIWAVGVWGRRKSMARVLRCDGILTEASAPVAEIQAIKTFVAEQRTLASPFDIVMEADTRDDTPEQAQAKVRTWADTGVTWWVETMWSPESSVADTRTRIQQGPPRFAPA